MWNVCILGSWSVHNWIQTTMWYTHSVCGVALDVLCCTAQGSPVNKQVCTGQLQQAHMPAHVNGLCELWRRSIQKSLHCVKGASVLKTHCWISNVQHTSAQPCRVCSSSFAQPASAWPHYGPFVLVTHHTANGQSILSILHLYDDTPCATLATMTGSTLDSRLR